MSVYADCTDTLSRGGLSSPVGSLLPAEAVLVGIGRASMSRGDMFSGARGKAVDLDERLWEAPPMSDFVSLGRGRFMLQALPAMVAARVLAPCPGERVLDMCAAPGGKATHLAEIMGGVGEVSRESSQTNYANTLILKHVSPLSLLSPLSPSRCFFLSLPLSSPRFFLPLSHPLMNVSPHTPKVVACDRGQSKVDAMRVLAASHGLEACVVPTKADATTCVNDATFDAEVIMPRSFPRNDATCTTFALATIPGSRNKFLAVWAPLDSTPFAEL